MPTETAPPTEIPTDQTGGGGTGGGAFAGKACDLLTAAEVESATKLTGITPSELASSNTEGLAACAYLVQSGAPALVVTVLDPANTNTDVSAYASLPGSTLVAVTGGANAVWVGTIGALIVIKNGVAVSLQLVAPAPGEEVQQTAAKLAQPVADRLP